MRNFTSKLAPIIKEYLEFRKALGYSIAHEQCLAKLDSYYREHHQNSETLTKDSVRGWVNYEVSRGGGQMHGKAAAVRALARYMGNGAYILPHMAAVKSPPRFVPYIFTDDELSRLFIAADSIEENNFGNNGITSLRFIFPTLLRLQYTCGLRPAETRLIKRDNINFDTGEILLEKTKGCKGHKERVVVMSDDMLIQCRKYDVIRAITNPQSEFFFVRADGNPVPMQQLCKTFKRCWKRANPNVPANMLPRVRLYDLRHRFASTVLQKWLNEGRDLYAMLPYLREYMGHEYFSDTAYYIHLLPENLLNSPGIDWSAMDSVTPEVDIWES